MENTMVSSKESQHVFFDVDDTLVMWNYSEDTPIEELIEILVDKESRPDIYKNMSLYLKPHDKHCEHLIKYKLKGHTVVVWSAGGAKWAEAVVKALKLEKYVDFTMSKPNIYYDDVKVTDFMPEQARYYFNEMGKRIKSHD